MTSTPSFGDVQRNAAHLLSGNMAEFQSSSSPSGPSGPPASEMILPSGKGGKLKKCPGKKAGGGKSLVLVYSIILGALGLAIIYLITRVRKQDKTIQQLRTEVKQNLSDSDVNDLITTYIGNPNNADALRHTIGTLMPWDAINSMQKQQLSLFYQQQQQQQQGQGQEHGDESDGEAEDSESNDGDDDGSSTSGSGSENGSDDRVFLPTGAGSASALHVLAGMFAPLMRAQLDPTQGPSIQEVEDADEQDEKKDVENQEEKESKNREPKKEETETEPQVTAPKPKPKKGGRRKKKDEEPK